MKRGNRELDSRRYDLLLRRRVNLTTVYLMPSRTRTKSNVPQNEPLRWNVEVGGRELGLANATLRKALNKSGAIPDEHGCFSTRQLIAAVFGAIDLEKLRTQEQITRKYQLDNAIVEASVVRKDELMKVLGAVADAMTSRIRASELSRHAQDDLLRDIAGIPLSVTDVARRQSRLPARRNGNGDGEQ